MNILINYEAICMPIRNKHQMWSDIAEDDTCKNIRVKVSKAMQLIGKVLSIYNMVAPPLF